MAHKKHIPPEQNGRMSNRDPVNVADKKKLVPDRERPPLPATPPAKTQGAADFELLKKKILQRPGTASKLHNRQPSIGVAATKGQPKHTVAEKAQQASRDIARAARDAARDTQTNASKTTPPPRVKTQEILGNLHPDAAQLHAQAKLNINEQASARLQQARENFRLMERKELPQAKQIDVAAGGSFGAVGESFATAKVSENARATSLANGAQQQVPNAGIAKMPAGPLTSSVDQIAGLEQVHATLAAAGARQFEPTPEQMRILEADIDPLQRALLKREMRSAAEKQSDGEM